MQKLSLKQSPAWIQLYEREWSQAGSIIYSERSEIESGNALALVIYNSRARDLES